MKDSLISISQSWGDRVSISAGDSRAAADYRFDASLPKPCFHPLTTPAGHQLTGFEMSDHIWHRGLWFTIKFINGTNFWEEHSPFGVQKSAAEPVCRFLSPTEVLLSHDLQWTSEATGPVLRENRAMRFQSHASGIRSIDWICDLHAAADLLLDRTPYTTWGGYGGLSFRGSRELHDAIFMLPNGETTASLAGQPHDWVIMHAAVDGGANQRVSLAVVDHPKNPRSPSPWYCKSGNGFNYLNAAFLFHEALAMKKEQTLRFRYRVFYRDGVWTTKEFQTLADEFRSSEEIR